MIHIWEGKENITMFADAFNIVFPGSLIFADSLIIAN